MPAEHTKREHGRAADAVFAVNQHPRALCEVVLGENHPALERLERGRMQVLVRQVQERNAAVSERHLVVAGFQPQVHQGGELMIAHELDCSLAGKGAADRQRRRDPVEVRRPKLR